MLKKLFAGLTVFTLAAIVGVSLGRAEDGEVLSHVKITDGVGGLEATFTGVDNFGAGVSDIGDLNGDGVSDIVVGAPYDSEMTDGGGAVYILFLETNGSLHTAQVGGAPAAGYQKISATTGGGVGAIDDYDGFGMSVAGIGDVDGDGIPDIAVGSPFDQTNKGSIYVIFLDRNGTMDDTVEYVKIGGAGSGGMPAVIGDFEQFGYSVANAGDLNSDGIAEIAVGSWSNDTGGSNRGSVYILFLDNTGSLDGSSGVSGVGYTFIANNTGGLAYTLGNGDNFGVSVAGLGDINGDEIPDIAVGAAKDDTAGDNKGTVFILFLDTDGQVLDEQRITDSVGGFTTLGAGDYFGYSVAGLSDMNGDGVNDLAVGAYGDDDGGSNFGAAYILFLTATGELDGASGTSGSGYTKISAEAGGFAGTLEADDYFGNGLGALADMNDDGIPELVAGAYLDDDAGGNRGAIYILFLDGTLAESPSTPSAPNPPSAFTFGIADTGTCTWDPNIYLSVRGSNLAQVIVSDNLRFVGAQVLPYTPNNGSTVLPDHLSPVDNTMYIAFKLPSYATSVNPATGEQMEVPLYGPYSVYAVGRSGSGNITSIQTDSITFASGEDCTYPYEVVLEEDTENGSEEGNEGEGTIPEDQDPLIPVERHQIISLSANMNDLTNEFYLVDTAADGSLVKRPDPRVTNYDISFSWLNKGYSFLSVNQRTLDSLPTAHSMLPEGPAILKFTEGSQNYFYIPSDNSAPREITTPNLANELFLGTPWTQSLWILGPEVPSSSVPHGRTIPRYDVSIVRDWRNR